MIKFGLGLFVGINVGVAIGYGHPHLMDEALIKMYKVDPSRVKQFREENAYGKKWERDSKEAPTS